jgi:hypothetical protein
MFPRSQNLSDDDRRLPEPSRKFLSSGLSPKKQDKPQAGDRDSSSTAFEKPR